MQATLLSSAALDPCAAVSPADVWQPSERLSPRRAPPPRRVLVILQPGISQRGPRLTRPARIGTSSTRSGAGPTSPRSRCSSRVSARTCWRPRRRSTCLPASGSEPLPVRQALFFREVAAHHLPTRILEGELIVGSHFSTALSRCLNKHEARERDRHEQAFLEEWRDLNGLGVGNCAAVPGHLIPDYPRVLHVGWQGLSDEAQAVLDAPGSAPEQQRAGAGDRRSARKPRRRSANATRPRPSGWPRPRATRTGRPSCGRSPASAAKCPGSRRRPSPKRCRRCGPPTCC